MSNRQYYNNNYNNTPYGTPSMHSRFTQRQSNVNITDKSRAPRGRGRGRGRTRTRGRGRGRGYTGNNQRSGYGYVGIMKNEPHDKYKKYHNNESSSSSCCCSNSDIGNDVITTKSKYYKSETIADKILSNEIRIQGSGNNTQEYVDCGLEMLNGKNGKKEEIICITATGREISRAINCCEIIKRKQYGLYQETLIEYKTIREIWLPLELCLKRREIEHELIYIKILLTFNNKLININSIGYQQPISWIDLGDAKELYNKMKGKINKLQNKLNDKLSQIDGLEDKFYDKSDELNNLKLKEIKNEKDFNDLENKYDEKLDIINQKQLIINKQINDYKNLTNNMDKLQEKYNKLKLKTEKKELEIINNNNNNNNKYSNLNAKQLVEFIINLNLKNYLKYKDGLLRGFIEEGVDGSCLNELTKEDLYRFGITQFKDKLSIYKKIKNLFE